MTPPGATVAGECAGSAEAPPAVFVRLETLRKRSDFLAAARARRIVTLGFILQARDRKDGETISRVGFTCSKKVGNAVQRNHAKRRLREIARLTVPQCGRPGWDYVLVGRVGKTASLPFESLRSDLFDALAQIHSGLT